MRIQHFTIREYKVLHQLTLPWEQTSQITPSSQTTTYKLDLVVGVNGTGKTTYLRLLAELFQLLYNKADIPFTFSVTYLIQQSTPPSLTINISNQAEDKQKKLEAGHELVQEQSLYIRVEDSTGRIIKESLVDAIDEQYLPHYVIALTSGSEKGWEIEDYPTINNRRHITPLPQKERPNLEQTLLDWYKRERPLPHPHPLFQPDTKRSASNFLFIRNQHLPLIILCGLLVDMQAQERILTDALYEVKIRALSGFSLRLFLDEVNIVTDDRTFIQRLIDQSSYTIKQGLSHLIVFNLHTAQEKPTAIQRLAELIQSHGHALEFFKRLNLLMQQTSGREAVLQEMNLFFERDYTLGQQTQPKIPQANEQQASPLHMLEWFSDGEISFLGRFCLFSLLRGIEALVLLDEPEVHFNDYWKRQLVHKLDQALHDQYSHVIMTTHSSITLSDVYNTNIWVMKRNGDFTEYAAPPNVRTLGTDPSDIIIHVFGAESATGAQSIAYLQGEIQRILQLSDTQQKRGQLQTLLNYVGPGPLRFLIRRELYALEEDQLHQTQIQNGEQRSEQ